MKKFIDDNCDYRIFPLGKDFPLCLFETFREGKLDNVLPRDLPVCKGKKCPYKEKTIYEQEKNNNEKQF